VEGKTRIKINGTDFDDTSIITIEGIPLSDIRMAKEGKLLFGTLPALPEGTYDILISTDGHLNKIINPGIRYITDVVETARAVLMSVIINLQEIKDRANAMETAGTLTDIERDKLRLELDLTNQLSYEAIDQRMLLNETPPSIPALAQVYYKYLPLQHQLSQQIEGIIGS